MKRIELSTGEELALDIIDKKSDDGRRLARVPLEVSDFLLARDETWFRGLRAGALSEDLASHSMHVLPGENRGAGRLAGYAIEVFNGRSSYRRHFTTQSLAPVANRKVVEMIKEKSATLADDFGFFLTTVRSEANGNGQSEIEPLKATVRSEPLVFEEAVLSDYLAASEPMPSVAEPPLAKMCICGSSGKKAAGWPAAATRKNRPPSGPAASCATRNRATCSWCSTPASRPSTPSRKLTPSRSPAKPGPASASCSSAASGG